MTDADRKNFGGLGFELWTDRGAWFWRLAARRCGISTIGSASTATEALGDAHAAVEELSARCAQAGESRVNPIDRGDRGLPIAASEDSAAKPAK